MINFRSSISFSLLLNHIRLVLFIQYEKSNDFFITFFQSTYDCDLKIFIVLNLIIKISFFEFSFLNQKK